MPTLYDPLAESSTPPPLSLISTVRVPNEPPETDVPYRLAIIGEAPGADEEATGRPFVGPSGRLLDGLLGQCGILRSGCFVGNVCKYRPPGNEIKSFGYNHEKVQEGWKELQEELATFRPNCILALGNTPLHFLTSRVGITAWRGSIIGLPQGKCVPGIHPAAVLREYKQWVLLRFDILRARAESESPLLVLPKRTLELDLSPNEICYRLDNWPSELLLSFDIEGGLDAFPCCSVADSPSRGFIIAWSRMSEGDQCRVALSLSRVLNNPHIPKCLQNSLYDRFVLAYGYRMHIRNVREDTMLKQWEIYPELPKGLGTIASIWTREPYYKYERKTDDPNTFYEYCIKDSCVTLEACNAQDQALTENARRHYRFNMGLLDPLLFMELRGIQYDSTSAASRLTEVRASLTECSARLQLHAGYDLTGAKGSVSATKLKKCLYAEKGYPEQKKGRGPEAKVSTDVEALLKLKKKFQHDPFLSDILLHRKLESVAETLSITADSDERVRCGYNLVGTETGRLTCYTSPTGSGANLQTITKKLRVLYRADPDHWLFQCDLSGADGWTIAAHCLRHGDPTMWDDYHYGLKPARLIALFYDHPDYIKAPRDELKAACKDLVDDEGWLYFASKRIQHATNYLVGEITAAKQIMLDSYKLTGSPIYVLPATCGSLQRVYTTRYSGLFRYHDWARREVYEGRDLETCFGHTRKFFGRRRSYNYKTRSVEADHETLKEFVASEPQFNTTLATNLALHKLWYDSSNTLPTPERIPLPLGGTLLQSRIVQPLHQVHDALIGQFRKESTSWAVPFVQKIFQHTLRIAGVEVKIPFEGNYGPSWGELGEKYGGGSI